MSTVKRPTKRGASVSTMIAIVATAALAAGCAESEASVAREATRTAPSSEAMSEYLYRTGLDLAFAGSSDPGALLLAEGSRLDPQCVRCLWGLAWALGTEIDGVVPGERRAEARSALRRARSVLESATERERALVEALELRYDARIGRSTARREQAFIEAMRTFVYRNPDDADAHVVLAIALIAGEQSDHWSQANGPRPAIREALAATGRAAAISPEHPGVKAVYRHVAEDLRMYYSE